MFALVRDVKTLYTTHRKHTGVSSFRKSTEINKCAAVSPAQSCFFFKFDLILECLSTVNLHPKSLFWQKKKSEEALYSIFVIRNTKINDLLCLLLPLKLSLLSKEKMVKLLCFLIAVPRKRR